MRFHYRNTDPSNHGSDCCHGYDRHPLSDPEPDDRTHTASSDPLTVPLTLTLTLSLTLALTPILPNRNRNPKPNLNPMLGLTDFHAHCPYLNMILPFPSSDSEYVHCADRDIEPVL